MVKLDPHYGKIILRRLLKKQDEMIKAEYFLFGTRETDEIILTR